MKIEIREAAIDEILPIRHQVLWPDKPFEFVKVEDDATGKHFGLYLNGQIVTVISLFADGQSLRFRKFATLAQFQNKGLGKKMMDFVVEYTRNNGFERLWCDARADALNFYNREGFVKFTEVFDKAGVAYYKIEKRF